MNKRSGLGKSKSPWRKQEHETTNAQEVYYISVPVEGIRQTPMSQALYTYNSKTKLAEV